MENLKINVKVVEDNRPSVVEFGKLYGHRIFKADRIACDPAFNEHLREAEGNNSILTNRPIFRYKVTAIDIVALDLDKAIDGSNVIVINRGRVDDAGNSVEVRCPIDNSKFTKEVSTETITEALNKKGTNATFFASGKKLAEALNTANMSEITRVDNLIEMLKKQREMIDTTATRNSDSVSSYYHQLDDKKNVNVNVTVID